MASVTLLIDLVDAEPPLRRTVRVPRDVSLPNLHEVIQSAVGWNRSHLYGFARGDSFWQATDRWSLMPDDTDDDDVHSATLADLLGERDRALTYMYDFGDDWEHRLTVVETDPQETLDRAVLIDGEGGPGVDDCGGVYGRQDLIESLHRLDRGETLEDDEAEVVSHLTGGADPSRALAFFTDFRRARTAEALAQLGDISGSRRSAAPSPVDGSAAPPGRYSPEALAAARPELRDVLGRAAIAGGPSGARLLRRARLTEIDPLDDADCTQATRVVRAYLRAVGDGVDLTKSGYIRPADTPGVVDVLPGTAEWIGATNREHLLPFAVAFRKLLTSARLLRTSKGKLLPVKAAAPLLADDRTLTQRLIETLPLEPEGFERDTQLLKLLEELGTGAEDDGGAPAPGLGGDVLAALNEAGWQNADGGELVPAHLFRADASTLIAVHQLGIYEGRSLSRRLTETGRRFIGAALCDGGMEHPSGRDLGGAACSRASAGFRRKT